MRAFVSAGLLPIVCQSYAKSMGLYVGSEREGARECRHEERDWRMVYWIRTNEPKSDTTRLLGTYTRYLYRVKMGPHLIT